MIFVVKNAFFYNINFTPLIRKLVLVLRIIRGGGGCTFYGRIPKKKKKVGNEVKRQDKDNEIQKKKRESVVRIGCKKINSPVKRSKIKKKKKGKK